MDLNQTKPKPRPDDVPVGNVKRESGAVTESIRPKTIEKRPRDRAKEFGDLEYRADLDTQLSWNPIARLGFDPDKHKVLRSGLDPMAAYLRDITNFGKRALEKGYISPEEEKKIKDDNIITGSDVSVSPIIAHEFTHRGFNILRNKMNENPEAFEEKYGKQARRILEATSEGDLKSDFEEYYVELFDDLDTKFNSDAFRIRGFGDDLRRTVQSSNIGPNFSLGHSLEKYRNARIKQIKTFQDNIEKYRKKGKLSGAAQGVTQDINNGILGLMDAAQDILTEQGEPPKAKRKSLSFFEKLGKMVGFDEGGLAQDDQMGILGFSAQGVQQEVDKYVDKDAEPAKDITFKDAAKFVAELTPIIGDAMAAKEVYDELQKEDPNYFLAGALGGAAIIGLIPGIGDAAASAIRAGARKAFDVGKNVEIDPTAMSAFGAGAIRKKPTQDVWSYPDQLYDSAETSINVSKKPAGYNELKKRGEIKDGDLIVDIGGGKFDNLVDDAADQGATVKVYDPFNRSPEHNKLVVESVKDGQADTAMSHNVLNVIQEDKNIINIARQAENAIKPGGKAHFSVYEGTGKGKGNVTTKGYQRNQKTQDYIPLIEEVFGEGNVTRKGKIITATKPTQTVVKSFKSPKGTTFKRGGKFGGLDFPVGKVIGGNQVYFHKNYIKNQPKEVQDLYNKAIKKLPPDHKFNTLMYMKGKGDAPDIIRFDESADFDIAREPTPGKMIAVDSQGNVAKRKSNQIFHHKWMWVDDNYKGFDVNKEYSWSKEWTSKVDNFSGIGKKENWDKILKEKGLSLFNKGGMAMSNQMEMAFMNEGGIADDGMDVDPVSGNEVPPGSLAEEVRDDIPAQLSEGEYVVPADVVRYYGVKFFEDLRDEAKRGLAQMEADGRIGGEPVPDGGPINDQELSEQEMAAIREVMGMAEGGEVQNPYLQQQQLYSQPRPAPIDEKRNTTITNVNPVENQMPMQSMASGGQVQGYQGGGAETTTTPSYAQNIFSPGTFPLGFSFMGQPQQTTMISSPTTSTTPTTPGGTTVITPVTGEKPTLTLYGPEGQIRTFILPLSEEDKKTVADLREAGYSETQTVIPVEKETKPETKDPVSSDSMKKVFGKEKKKEPVNFKDEKSIKDAIGDYHSSGPLKGALLAGAINPGVGLLTYFAGSKSQDKQKDYLLKGIDERLSSPLDPPEKVRLEKLRQELLDKDTYEASINKKSKELGLFDGFLDKVKGSLTNEDIKVVKAKYNNSSKNASDAWQNATKLKNSLHPSDDPIAYHKAIKAQSEASRAFTALKREEMARKKDPSTVDPEAI